MRSEISYLFLVELCCFSVQCLEETWLLSPTLYQPGYASPKWIYERLFQLHSLCLLKVLIHDPCRPYGRGGPSEADLKRIVCQH